MNTCTLHRFNLSFTKKKKKQTKKKNKKKKHLYVSGNQKYCGNAECDYRTVFEKKKIILMSSLISKYFYSTGRFVLCIALCYFVLVFFSPLSIAITSLGRERASVGAFCTFVRFALVWFCLFPLPLGVLEAAAVCDCGTPWTFLLPFF